MSEEILRSYGLKVTEPRLRILEVIASGNHLSADQIFNQLQVSGHAGIGLATVYRVLTQFEVAGLIYKHHFDEGVAVFEMGGGQHHDHIVCRVCGHIEEFYDEAIEQRQQEIADKHGFKMQSHIMTMYGVCKNCAANN